MADGNPKPDPVPSPPPADAFDVPTYPDPPPWEPHDVEVSLSPPPGGTFDVPVFPDPPPAEPFDVPVYPDGPPWEPKKFNPALSPPPVEPFDPGGDAPPLPPAEPFDVATTPSDPPAGARQPQFWPENQQSGVEPLETLGQTRQDVEEELGKRLAEGEALSTTPALSSTQVPRRDHTEGVPALRTLPDNPTVDDIVASVAERDATLAAMLDDLLDGNGRRLFDTRDVSTPYAGALDPRVLADSFAEISSDLGRLAKFMAEQSLLYAMNAEVARVFNPAYFATMIVPGAMGNIPTAIDVALGNTMDERVRIKDELNRNIVLLGTTPGADKNLYADNFGGGVPYDEAQDFTVDRMVDAAVDGSPLLDLPLTRDQGIARYDATKHFNERDNAFKADVVANVLSRRHSVSDSHGRLTRSAATNGVIRVKIRGEDDDGSKTSATSDPSDGPDGVDDDDARVPISFTDLRHLPNERYRSVYFQPMNLTISETLSPEYNEQTAFGRTDAAVTYVKTSRSYSVSFELHVFAPEDLTVMHQKVNHLRSMVYPTYGYDGLMRSGPVAKMRIGDLVRSDVGGISGVIRSLSIDYNEALWELKRGMKTPRSCSISLEFLALHEGPVGMLDGKFGVVKVPDKATRVDTVLPDRFVRMPRGA